MTSKMSVERLNDDAETSKEFFYLTNAINANVIARTRIGWMRFRECGEKRFCKR